MRNITQGILDLFAERVANPVLMAEFRFDSGTIGMWTGYGELVWNETTFFGGGNLVGVSPVQETQDLQALGLVFQLNGVNSGLVSAVLTERVRGRPCRLYLAGLRGTRAIDLEDDSGAVETENGGLVLLENQLVDQPYKIFSGMMEKASVKDNGETSDIQVTAESSLMLLRRSKVRRNTAEDQKRFYPQDRGLDFINQLQDREIVW